MARLEVLKVALDLCAERFSGSRLLQILSPNQPDDSDQSRYSLRGTKAFNLGHIPIRALLRASEELGIQLAFD